MSSISIPTSFGEVFDRLSILQIKREFIKDESRRVHVVFEHAEISRILEEQKLECPRELYEQLVEVNTKIWHKMDLLRDVPITSPNWTMECKETLDLNDVRFSIKNQINVAMGSAIREMKGYEGL